MQNKVLQHEVRLCRADCIAFFKSCSASRDVEAGSRLHAELTEKGFLENSDVFIATALVNMYGKCGIFAKAQEIFDSIAVRDVILWTALMSGHVECGQDDEAIDCMEKMQQEGISPNAFTFVCGLKACGSVRCAEKLRTLHAEIMKKGLEHEMLIGSTLVDVYAKCCMIKTAAEVFDMLAVRSDVAWTALMMGYIDHGQAQQALDCFDRMQYDGILPDVVTFICTLKACGIIGVGGSGKGQIIHTQIVMKGLQSDCMIGSALVSMYAKCGLFYEAEDVCHKLVDQDVVSWNALIAGYAAHGQSEKIFFCLKCMQCEGISPDFITYVFGLKACGNIQDNVEILKILHANAVTKGFEADLRIGISLVDAYAKCGFLEEAQHAVGRLQVCEAVPWTALMAGYSEHGYGGKALDCLEKMQLSGIPFNEVTLVCSLKTCGSVGSLTKGREMHADIAKKGLEEVHIVGNALIDLYSKSGLPMSARTVFFKLQVHDLVSWNALLAAFSQMGDIINVSHCFYQLVMEGLEPDVVTFSIILSGYSHAGLQNDAVIFLYTIMKNYSFLPSLEHYTCIVDLLGRAGQVKEAVMIASMMPVQPGTLMWHSILGACQKWYNMELGKLAFEHAQQLNENDLGAYLCMANIQKNILR